MAATTQTNPAMNPTEGEMMKNLTRYVKRQIERNEGIVKDSMEDLTRDFNERFEWLGEQVYKGNLKLEFLR